MDPLVKAVKALRQHLGDSQQAFANRLGLSIRAIANYEKDRRPTGNALASLAKAASESGKDDLMNTFMTALMEELGISDIPFQLMSAKREGNQLRGFMLVHLEGKELVEYGFAIWDTLQNLGSSRPETRARALELLNRLKTAVEEERPIPAWARRGTGNAE